MTNNLITRIGVQVDDVYRRLYKIQDTVNKIQDPYNTEKVTFYDTDIISTTSTTNGNVILSYEYIKDGETRITNITKSFQKSIYGKLVDYILYNNEHVVFIFQRDIILLVITRDSTDVDNPLWYKLKASPIEAENTIGFISQSGFNETKIIAYYYKSDTEISKLEANITDTTNTFVSIT